VLIDDEDMEYGDEDGEAAAEVGGPVRSGCAGHVERRRARLCCWERAVLPARPACRGVTELGGVHPGVAHLPCGRLCG